MTGAEKLEAIRAVHYAEPLAYTHADDRAFLLAEVERLREALKPVAELCNWIGPIKDTSHKVEILAVVVQAARSALKGVQNP